MDVYVREVDLMGGVIFYQVWVDGKVYTTMHLYKRPRLTFWQQNEIARNFREALEDAKD